MNRSLEVTHLLLLASLLLAVQAAAGCNVFEDLEALRSQGAACEIEDACAGCQPRNACGGCTGLSGAPGAACGTCESGEWACDGEDAVACMGDEGAEAMNACGGCEALEGEPGSACGACGSGEWACDRQEAVLCMGDAGDAVRNVCGGCTALTGALGDPCGTCGSGELACDGEDALTCMGDGGEGARNACGGCAALTGTIGEACGPDPCITRQCAADGESLECMTAETTSYYADTDMDSFGDPASVMESCQPVPGTSTNALDCDDGDGNINPDADEIADDGIDNNCDGAVRISPPSAPTMLGSPEEEAGRNADEALHPVALTWALDVDTDEVTLGEWAEVFGERPQTPAACATDSCPVRCVNHFEALEYLNRRSVADGLTACYTLSDCHGEFGVGCDGGNGACADNYVCDTVTFAGLSCDGWRLPTEAEWEYLARGGAAAATYRGATSGMGCNEPNLNPIAWYCGNAGNAAHPVRGRTPNAYGLHDVLGNVAEWAGDYYAAYPAEVTVDPEGGPPDIYRVVRGGGWSDDASALRAAWRLNRMPCRREASLGFRAVRSLERVCDPADHQTDDVNCGCAGPCGTTCADGVCM